MTQEGDVVLVYMDNNPAFFARVEAINADVKPGWYQVKMLVLQIPLLIITWILREVYINGDEFTMGGRPVRVVKVVTPEEESLESDVELPGGPAPETAKSTSKPSEQTERGKVVSLADRRKKDQPS
ncbi:MAG: hypothetical protein GX422_17685 [Deltaproteobacteria bacterium]|nr:hypothetical protein [Deltaproteobacteria bacterium]